MITTGAKFFFGLAALAMVGAVAFSWSLHGGLTGALTMGFYGGLGGQSGYIILMGAAALSFFTRGLIIALRGADYEMQAQVAHVDEVPVEDAPRPARHLAVIGARAPAGALPW